MRLKQYFKKKDAALFMEVPKECRVDVFCHTLDIFSPPWEVCLVYGVQSAQHLVTFIETYSSERKQGRSSEEGWEKAEANVRNPRKLEELMVNSRLSELLIRVAKEGPLPLTALTPYEYESYERYAPFNFVTEQDGRIAVRGRILREWLQDS